MRHCIFHVHSWVLILQSTKNRQNRLVNHISGQSFFPNTSARNLCEGCWQTWASSHWRWQFYQSDHLCWQRMLHKLNQLCILLPEDRRMQTFFIRTDGPDIEDKKIQNKICYITAMLNVYLFCSHKDTFCWKIKDIPQHLDLEKCMTDQLLWASKHSFAELHGLVHIP